jgi:hypothetical protein
MNPAERSIREEAIRSTFEKMLKKHPDQKKLLESLLKVKLEALQNHV